MNRASNDPNSQRVLFVKNLNYAITGEDLYDLFGKYGAIRQVRLGTDAAAKTKGTAYIVYEHADDAKEAMNHLNGFHLAERYIVVLYHHPTRQQQAVVKATELREREEALAEEKKKLGMTD
ncbi:hypothetical protein FFLO_04427 [Filobasidium floriforme]|uniref:RRM domain-containing protein n=1 Tax=Filobasidium floriforme TaxID=5210 RepID=A0A8K0JIR5_9TREE|nr:uncharacterized protein HD553DRAFT_348398 [Filobasidium floriforme]KAG7531306.1 hypothetical protein FFLO_04427 [Filobasidium floriforme]KAH8088556.1 hypothetical protein HD553DRAFT_348398 [Filobasidium floriforme]